MKPYDRHFLIQIDDNGEPDTMEGAMIRETAPVQMETAQARAARA